MFLFNAFECRYSPEEGGPSHFQRDRCLQLYSEAVNIYKVYKYPGYTPIDLSGFFALAYHFTTGHRSSDVALFTTATDTMSCKSYWEECLS